MTRIRRHFNDVNGYRVFRYHSPESTTMLTPVDSKLDKKIFGLELEGDNNVEFEPCSQGCRHCDGCGSEPVWVNYDAIDCLENAIMDRKIISLDTMHDRKNDNNVIISYDGSVNFELGFQATQERNLLKNIKTLNNYGFNSGIMDNTTETSCHIHCNLQYIENNGGNMLEMQRATEFMIGVLYRVAHRDLSSYQWCSSKTDFRNYDKSKTDSLQKSMLELARDADNITVLDCGYDSPHSIACNAQHDNTAELRIFSNKFNWDYDGIKTNLEFSDFLIQLACYMNGRSYVDEFETLLDWTDDFVFNGTRRRRNYLQQFHLEDYIVPSSELYIIDFNNKWSRLYDKFEMLEHDITHMPRDEQVRAVLRFIRNNNLNYSSQMEFGDNLYFYKVDTNSIREALNRNYTIERNNL